MPSEEAAAVMQAGAVDPGPSVEQRCQQGLTFSERTGVECGTEGPGVLAASDLDGEGCPPRAGGAEVGNTEKHSHTHMLPRGRIARCTYKGRTGAEQKRAMMKE